MEALRALLDAGHHVFVHCTAGMSRSCAVGVLYLAKHHGLEPDAALGHIRKYRQIAVPYIEAVRKLARRGTLMRLTRPFSSS